MEIKELVVSIEPQPTNWGGVLLRIKVKTWGKDYWYEKPLPDDDLASLWDRLWERTGEEIKSLMKEAAGT